MKWRWLSVNGAPAQPARIRARRPWHPPPQSRWHFRRKARRSRLVRGQLLKVLDQQLRTATPPDGRRSQHQKGSRQNDERTRQASAPSISPRSVGTVKPPSILVALAPTKVSKKS